MTQNWPLVRFVANRWIGHWGAIPALALAKQRTRHSGVAGL
jgi:hypothetical protein